MNRHGRRRTRGLMARNPRSTPSAASPAQGASPKQLSYRVSRARPRALLLGTALTSTLLVAGFAFPSEGNAASSCTAGGAVVALPAPPNPIDLSLAGAEIVCVNGDPRTADDVPPGEDSAIYLATSSAYNYINLTNTGELSVTASPMVMPSMPGRMDREAASPLRIEAMPV